MGDYVASSLQNHVYLGFWTNWSRGVILGRTLTLSRENGAYLSSFITILVTFTGTATWKIIRFLLHRYLSSPNGADAIHHQRQAILRNSESSLSSFWKLLELT